MTRRRDKKETPKLSRFKATVKETWRYNVEVDATDEKDAMRRLLATEGECLDALQIGWACESVVAMKEDPKG